MSVFPTMTFTEVSNLVPAAPRGYSSLIKELLGSFRVIGIVLFDLGGPLTKRDVIPIHPYYPLRVSYLQDPSSM